MDFTLLNSSHKTKWLLILCTNRVIEFEQERIEVITARVPSRNSGAFGLKCGLFSRVKSASPWTCVPKVQTALSRINWPKANQNRLWPRNQLALNAKWFTRMPSNDSRMIRCEQISTYTFHLTEWLTERVEHLKMSTPMSPCRDSFVE